MQLQQPHSGHGALQLYAFFLQLKKQTHKTQTHIIMYTRNTSSSVRESWRPRGWLAHLKFQFFVVVFAPVQLVGNVALRLAQYFYLTHEILRKYIKKKKCYLFNCY